MSSFKNMVARDIFGTFLDLDFFGEVHNVEGRDIPIVVDDEMLKEKQGGQALAIAQSSVLFYAKSTDIKEHAPGELLNLDGREYIVDDWSEDMGMVTVALSENVAI